MSKIRRYLISGLLVWLPIWITLLVLRFLIDLMDHSLLLLPKAYQPDHLLGFHVPGLGLIFSIIILFVTGVIAANFFGSRLLKLWEKIIARIPLVRSIHAGVKQTLESVFASKGQAFRRVLLVEYPRKGLWSIAFQTGDGCRIVSDTLGTEMITVFIPTTPNPTSGFLIIVPADEVHELNISIDAALKMIISLGVVQAEKCKS